MTSKVSSWVVCAVVCGSFLLGPAANAAKAPSTSSALVPEHRLVRPSWWRNLDGLNQWELSDLFVGRNIALARIDLGKTHVWLSTDAAGTVRGPLKVSPTITWAGFGDNGVVYLADQQGNLSTSTSVEALRSHAPKPLDQLGPIDVWDAGGTTIAGLNRADGILYLSHDGGASFDAVMFDDPPRRLAVRSDNVVVVGGRALHLSADGGGTWTTTQISLPGLRRTGQFIGAQDDCEEATLARDGRTWIPYVSSPSLWSWRYPFRASALALGAQGSIEPDHQLAPLAPLAAGKTALEVVRRCRSRRRGMGGGAGRIGGGGRVHRATRPDDIEDPCAVTRCLQPPPSGSDARFLSNGRCGDANARPRPLWSGFVPRSRRKAPDIAPMAMNRNACRQNALEAPGPVVVQTTSSVQLAAPHCRATRVVGQHGLAAVLCEDPARADATNVRVWNSTAWVVELRLEGRVRFSHQAGATARGEAPRDDDGTLLFEVEKNGARTAWVRKPIALGQTKAWRQVVVNDAVAHRTLTGGRVLVLASSDQKTLGTLTVTPSVFRPSVANADLQWAPSAAKTTLDRVHLCHVDRVRSDPSLQGAVDVKLRVATTGAVQGHIERMPIEDERWTRCITQAFAQTRMFVIDRKRRMLVEDDVRVTLQFKAENHAVDLWVDDDGSLTRIAREVVVDGAIRDLRVRADRRVEFDVGTAKSARWVTVPRSGRLPQAASVTPDRNAARATAVVDVRSVRGPQKPALVNQQLRSGSTGWGSCRGDTSKSLTSKSEKPWRIDLVVSEHGQVVTASGAHPSNAWRVTQCLERAAMKLRFPPARGGISTIDVAVSFREAPKG